MRITHPKLKKTEENKMKTSVFWIFEDDLKYIQDMVEAGFFPNMSCIIRNAIYTLLAHDPSTIYMLPLKKTRNVSCHLPPKLKIYIDIKFKPYYLGQVVRFAVKQFIEQIKERLKNDDFDPTNQES